MGHPPVQYGTYTTLNAEGNPLFDDLPANPTPALTTSNAYDAVGNLDLVTMPTGNTEDYMYDGLGRLEHVIVKKGVNDVFRQDYTLRDDGSRASVIEKRYEAGSVVQKTKISWVYDDQGHLTKETRDGDTTPGNANDNFDAYETIDGVADYIDDYGFDLAGNRITKGHDAAGTSNDETVTSTYNDRDQLRIENSTVHGRSADDYDANGSLIAKRSGVDTLGAGGSTVETYAWDLRGRMTSATVGTETTTFGYDSTGMRAARTVGSNLTTKFLNDKLNPTGYAKAIEESTSAGVKRSYLLGIDILMQADADGTVQLIKDGHGTTRALVNLLGAITQMFEFDAYANLLNMQASAAKTEWLSPDGRRDVSTGLNYNLARYVDPETGTFVSFDSFEADPASPANVHKYVLDQSNPQNRSDPSGHSSLGELQLTNLIQNTLAKVHAGQKVLRAYRQIETAFDFLSAIINLGTAVSIGGFGALGIPMGKPISSLAQSILWAGHELAEEILHAPANLFSAVVSASPRIAATNVKSLEKDRRIYNAFTADDAAVVLYLPGFFGAIMTGPPINTPLSIRVKGKRIPIKLSTQGGFSLMGMGIYGDGLKVDLFHVDAVTADKPAHGPGNMSARDLDAWTANSGRFEINFQVPK
jgi:RHS repeat-associated protein